MSKFSRPTILFSSLLLGSLLSILVILLAAGKTPALAASSAATWYVDQATGSDGYDCLAPGSACKTIGAAVLKAVQGDTISIGAGVYTENLDITGVNLTGLGPEVTILDGGYAGRVLETNNTVQVSNLAIRNGLLPSGQNGAGVLNYGTLLLSNTNIYSNTAISSGGGIYNAGSLTIQNSQVVSNTSNGAGGGIRNWYNAPVTATQSTIRGNTAISGGGIYNQSSLFLEDAIVQGNTSSQSGAGVYNNYGAVAELNRTSLIYNYTAATGAGLYNPGGVITMTNSTLAENTGHSLAFHTHGETAFVTLLNSTIVHNHNSSGSNNPGGVVVDSEATLHIKNTIVALNDGNECRTSSNWISEGHNLAGDFSCNFKSPGDLELTDPALGALGYYQGETPSYPPLPGSPAVDAGDNTGCPSGDQRKAPRPFDGDTDGAAVCDIGSFELRSQLSIADTTIQEGDSGSSSAVFTVTVAPTSTAPITVSYATSADTAAGGVDYADGAGQLVFAPGEQSKAIHITIYGDKDEENDETFWVVLLNANGADVVDDTAVGTIVDDDGLPSLVIDDQSVAEGNSGLVLAVFNVTLSPASADTITVNYTTADDTAQAGLDYNAAAGQLTFNPGDILKTITVQVKGDTIDEGAAEAFKVVLSGPVKAILADGEGTGTITDDDLARLIFAGSPQIWEGDTGTSTAYFTVTLSLKTSFTVTVDYATMNGYGLTGAVAGQDYITATGTLTFAPGETLHTIPVQIIGDEVVEPDERFSMVYTNAHPLLIGQISDSATILNDEFMVYLPLVRR